MEALYRKYRPTTFSSVVGQEHIERTLKNAIEQDKVSHAYLFCGPRGTGKTTMARILAKALLCEKGPTTEPDGTCAECEAIAQGAHPDVYELDAASRTGVENVREEIISRVNYAPTRGSWKVYIIDEVHMLSTAAFNALLKTLEEPPAHVVFILCTTDPQKVPETIHSRCQRFDFHRIGADAIVSRLGAICVEEGAEFEGEALDLIAHRCDGGMRNALTALEQLIAFGGGKVTLEGAQNLLGSLDDTDLSEVIIALGKRDAAACFNWLARYVETGADLAQFVMDLAEQVRNLYLLSMAGVEVEIEVSEATRKALVDQLKLFGPARLERMLAVLGDAAKELRSSTNPRLTFEIALTRMMRPESDSTLEALAERIEELERRIVQMSAAGIAAPSAQAVSVPAPVQASDRASAAAVTSVQTIPSAPAAPVRQASAPAPAPAPASAPASAPTPNRAVPASVAAPSPSHASGSAAAPRSAAQPAAPVAANPAASAAASVRSGGTLTASVDLANPAALQRFWHSVTSSLRKANPARGVLFMNAKVSAEPDAQGIIVAFSADNEFAFKAAQKAEVQALLADTIQTVAGGNVPFRLTLAGGAAPVSAPAPASQPVRRPAAAEQARAAVAAAVQAASARAQAAPAATPSFSAPASVPNASASAASPASQSAPAPVASARLASASPSASPAMGGAPIDDDRVPLDVYDSFASEQDESDPGYYGDPAPVPQPASRPVASTQANAPQPVPAPASNAQPAAMPVQPVGRPSVPQPPAASPQPAPVQAASRSVPAIPKAPSSAAAPVPVAPAPAASSASAPAPSPSNGEQRPVARPMPAQTPLAGAARSGGVAIHPSEELDGEARQIVDVLTGCFGDNVKFEELPD